MKNNQIKTIDLNGEEVGVISYANFIGLESETSKPFIMISELVDNSISSFENELEEKWTNENPLEIIIRFNFKGQYESTKIDPDIQYIKGSYIEVIDNGYGMKDYKDKTKPITKCLSDAVKYGNKNVQKSDKNKWGKGMKHCAYYFGQDIDIYTSNGNEAARIVRKFTDEKIMLDTPYPYDSESVKVEDSKTIIKIENIYKDKSFGLSAFKNIMDSLSWRYVNYLRAEKLKIKMIFEDSKDHLEEDLKHYDEAIRKLTDPVEKKATLSVRDRIITTGIEEFISRCQGRMERLITRQVSQQKDNEDEIDLTIFKRTFIKMKSLIENSVNDVKANVSLEDEIDLEIRNIKNNKMVKVPLKYWILPLNTPDKDAGIRLYEGMRAIRHKSTKDKTVNPWTDYQLKSDDANRTNKKFAGSIDLKPTGIEPVKDKSNFKMPDDIHVKLTRDIWSVFKAVEIFIIEIAKKNTEAVIEIEAVEVAKKDIEDSLKSINKNAKTMIDYIEDESDSKCVVLSRKNDNEEWKTRIVIDDKTKNSRHMIETHVISEKDIKIVLFVKHKVWKEIRSRSKDLSSFTRDLLSTRTHTLITHSINITKLLGIDETERTIGVKKILDEIGDEYLDQDL